MVAGTNMADYTTGKRKAVTAGNACQAKAVSLILPKGLYTYAVQTVSTAYQGSPFAKGQFEIESETAVQAQAAAATATTPYYHLNGTKARPDSTGILLTTQGKKLKK